MRRLLVLICLLYAVGGCASEKRFDVKGRVVGFGDNDSTIIIEHEAIPGFMPSMTMTFRSDAPLPPIRHGDAVGFELVVTPRRSWIERVQTLNSDGTTIAPATGKLPGTPPDALLDEGDVVPPAALISDAGAPFSLADYRGAVLVVDFIYTRCPLPDYCLLLSQKMAQLQQRYATDSTVQLLSVTLDPGFDTPEVLQRYRARYTDTPQGWRFATGTQAQIETVNGLFGQYIVGDGADLQHNLVTAVVDTEGRVHRFFRGQDWTVDELIREIEDARR